MTAGSEWRRRRSLGCIGLAAFAACVRVDVAPPSRKAVEAALGLECLPAAISGARVNIPGVVTTGDLVRFDLRAAYLGGNPFELHAGTRPKRLTDSFMENTAGQRAVAVWPIDLRLAVHRGAAPASDTVSYRCYALQDRLGELHVIERKPERTGSWATQLFGRLSSAFK